MTPRKRCAYDAGHAKQKPAFDVASCAISPEDFRAGVGKGSRRPSPSHTSAAGTISENWKKARVSLARRKTAADVIGESGKVRVCEEQCKTCVFRPGNPMWLRPGYLKEIIERNVKRGALLTCHKTLPYAPEVNDPAVCRGFWDGYAEKTECGLIAIHLIGFEFVTINQGDDIEQHEGQGSADPGDQPEEDEERQSAG